MESSPLFHPGWLEFNRSRWGAEPLRLRYEKKAGTPPVLETVLYLDARGRAFLPPLNYYFPIAYAPTPTQSASRLYRQWLEVAELYAEDLARRGVRDKIALPPEVVDVRSWQWSGFRATARYTFYIDFPFADAQMDQATRQNVQKALKAGYTSERARTLEDALLCLESAEERQGFDHRLSVADLARLRELMGDDAFRLYVCYSPEGQPACAKAVLHQPGARAIIWLSGTRQEFLSSCATQLQFRQILQELEADGATGCDFAGANIPGVARSKANWGGRLVPFYMLEPPGVMGLARYMRDYWHFLRLRRTCPQPS